MYCKIQTNRKIYHVVRSHKNHTIPISAFNNLKSTLPSLPALALNTSPIINVFGPHPYRTHRRFEPLPTYPNPQSQQKLR